MPKPKKVLDVIRSNDEKAHHAMSVAGGRKAGQLSKERAKLRALHKAEEQAKQEEFLRDAQEHAEANRIGWDDDYKE